MRQAAGQAAIEQVLALICAGVLFVGILATWQWLVAAMVQRQRNFNNSRVTAATPEEGKAGTMVNLGPKKLSIWNE